jgi:hypothetical protein
MNRILPAALLLALAATLAAAPLAAAGTSSYHRDVLGPSAVNVETVATAGFAFCTKVVVAALDCGTGGIGATIDVSDLNSAVAAGTDEFASGTCTVEPGSPNTGGAYGFICGVDRDDDGFVTNVDADGSQDPDGYDDDFAFGSDTDPTIDVCFRADADGLLINRIPAWDFVHVFVALNVPEVPAAVGFFAVDLTLTTYASACPNGANVSGHSHGTWYDPSSGDGPWCGFGVQDAVCLELLAILDA